MTRWLCYSRRPKQRPSRWPSHYGRRSGQIDIQADTQGSEFRRHQDDDLQSLGFQTWDESTDCPNLGRRAALAACLLGNPVVRSQGLLTTTATGRRRVSREEPSPKKLFPAQASATNKEKPHAGSHRSRTHSAKVSSSSSSSSSSVLHPPTSDTIPQYAQQCLACTCNSTKPPFPKSLAFSCVR
ncbi:hypothetical protein LZ31DRAFT_174630 [Colletotrichum somersetense]|nr:hypothetical protein LZ31DRAFT_174630 [Colletotrichum somersetense]